jgi:hypothetical protein
MPRPKPSPSEGARAASRGGYGGRGIIGLLAIGTVVYLVAGGGRP